MRTALAKGLPARRVVSRHAIRNAAIPVVTLAGFQTSALIGGSIFVEFVFNVAGLGRFGVDAILRQNMPALLGFVMVTAAVVVVVNIVLGLSYAWLMPKVRPEWATHWPPQAGAPTQASLPVWRFCPKSHPRVPAEAGSGRACGATRWPWRERSTWFSW